MAWEGPPHTRGMVRRQHGQSAVEYLGIITAVAIVAGLLLAAAPGLGQTVAGKIEAAITSLGPTDSDGPEPVEGGGPIPSSAQTPTAEQSAAGDGTPTDELPELDADGVPLPRPAPPPDEGSGPFDSADPSAGDRLTEAKWTAAAEYAELRGWTDAARHLRHYLGRSGETLDVSPEEILRDEPGFQSSVEEDVRRLEVEAQRRAAENHEPGRRFAMSTDWATYTAEGANWFRGLGTFSRHTTATATVLPPAQPGGRPRLRIEYKLHVADRYNWDKGKVTQLFGEEPTPDEELGRLHETGLAQEFDVRGSSEVVTTEIEVPSEPPPTPPEPGDPPLPEATGREGRSDQRTDPGREQGR